MYAHFNVSLGILRILRHGLSHAVRNGFVSTLDVVRASVSGARRQRSLTPAIRRVHRLSVDHTRVLHILMYLVALSVV